LYDEFVLDSTMPRYKETNKRQGQLIPVIFEEQVLPGTIEHAICNIIDHHVDLSVFNTRYNNDATGAPAVPPAVLLKLILVCYSKGIFSSRRMEEAVKTNVTLMAVAEGLTPDHATIARFVSSLGDVVNGIFVDVLIRYAQLDLVGGEVFALDGCKLPSNAAKEYSGTFAELKKKREKLAAVLKSLMEKHKAGDGDPEAEEKREKDQFKLLQAEGRKRIQEDLTQLEEERGRLQNEKESIAEQIEARIQELVRNKLERVRKSIEKSIENLEASRMETDEKETFVNHEISTLQNLIKNDHELFTAYSKTIRETLAEVDRTDCKAGNSVVEKAKTALKAIISTLLLGEKDIKIALGGVNHPRLHSSVFDLAPPIGRV
jgi:transposase